MDLSAIVQSINDSGVGEWMRMNVKALPIVNALHVIAIILVFGTILIVDLRLLGVPNTRRSFTRTSDELLKWTWGAFILAAVTGALLFAANANTYYGNTAFKLKMVALVLAGVNMLIFQFITIRGVAGWDKDVLPPMTARIAGVLSIVFWTGIIVLGRVIGFTKGYNFEVPDEVDPEMFDFGALDALRLAALECLAGVAQHLV